MTRDREVVFRHGYPVAVAWIGVALFAGLMLLLLIVAPGLGGKILTAGIMAGPGLFFLRMTQVGAHLRPNELVAVRTFSTVRLPWNEIKRFVIRPRGIQPLCVFAERNDGTFVWIEGLGPWFRFARVSPELDRVVVDMNRLRKRLQEAA